MDDCVEVVFVLSYMCSNLRSEPVLSLRLSNEIESRLAALARRTGRTKTFYAREAILIHLDDLEDYYLSAETVAGIRQGTEKTYTGDEVRKVLGLDD